VRGVPVQGLPLLLLLLVENEGHKLHGTGWENSQNTVAIRRAVVAGMTHPLAHAIRPTSHHLMSDQPRRLL